MKKLIVAATLLTLALSTQASRGGDRNLTLKNSMAGFASESIEHSMRLLYRTNPAVKDQVNGANVEIISAQDSAVSIELVDGTVFTYNCFRFDDWSRSGTVLKKEVVCRQ
ncbi:MAG: hypothetical protein NXH75_14045 [Halobacteriovoraceae bacterium]|nr:hypothetical protein [Halobacteriovoraceae bacterium]